jgi:hypothetical protein
MNWKEFFKGPFQVADISSTRPSCLVDSEENIILEVNCSSVMLVEPEESILIEVRKQVLKEIADYLNLKEVDEQMIWHEAHVKFHASDNMQEHWAFRAGAYWVLDYKASGMIAKLHEERLQLSTEVYEAQKTIENLKTVMIAAAEEIQDHWEAHTDKEGYGPSNLMLRLEKGVAENYLGYSAGAFAKLKDENRIMRECLEAIANSFCTLGEDAENMQQSAKETFKELEKLK